MVGKRYGLVEVVSLSEKRVVKNGYPNGEHYWTCKCDCGTKFDVRGSSLRRNECNSCGCQVKIKPSGNTNPLWGGYGAISGKRFHNYKRNAGKRNLPFGVTGDELWTIFEKQDGKCAYSGMSIDFDITTATASLDRIDSSQGYYANNVQWIHKDINQMKWDLPDSKFIELCKTIAKYRENG